MQRWVASIMLEDSIQKRSNLKDSIQRERVENRTRMAENLLVLPLKPAEVRRLMSTRMRMRMLVLITF